MDSPMDSQMKKLCSREQSFPDFRVGARRSGGKRNRRGGGYGGNREPPQSDEAYYCLSITSVPQIDHA